jgi:putative lipoic acid-binding regulatory protein
VSGVVVKDSRKGTFQSITITIEAKSEAQLSLIHRELMDTGLVSMVI